MKELNEKGQVLVFVAAALVGLALFVGLAIDSGRAYLLKAQMARRVDPAALAAAAEYKKIGSLPNAQAAACNAALMNGLSCAGLTVTQVSVPEPDGSTTPGIRVTATTTMATSFMRLGKLIGCTTCDAMTVTASAVAAPHSRIDLVMNLDDTGSMKDPIDWMGPAKDGANALVDAVVPAGSSSSLAKVSLVPFRGCYDTTTPPGTAGCENSKEYSVGTIVSLTTNNATLRGGVNALSAKGNSGSNLCEGLSEARKKLFESPGTVSRSSAQKFIVLLTDAETNIYVPASFTSPPNFRNCNPASGQNRTLSVTTNNLATDIKNGANVGPPLPQAGSTGQPLGTPVTIFVILYGNAASAAPYGNSCDALSTYPNQNTTDCAHQDDPLGYSSPQCQYARRLAECIVTPGDLYPAPTPDDVHSAFLEIIGKLPVRLAQ